MQQAVGHGNGDRQAENGVNDPDGIDAAITAKHLAEEQSAGESKRGEDEIGEMGGGKQGGGNPYGTRAAEQIFAASEEEGLQKEFLQKSPDDVSARAVEGRPGGHGGDLATDGLNEEDHHDGGGEADGENDARAERAGKT